MPLPPSSWSRRCRESEKTASVRRWVVVCGERARRVPDRPRLEGCVGEPRAVVRDEPEGVRLLRWMLVLAPPPLTKLPVLASPVMLPREFL